ncbi:MAG: hypothetical protein PHN57_00525 [Candidatus Omnitrophica bacterium]|nr:hypothetical protein [Candidatus Omnitrophota bacterium]
MAFFRKNIFILGVFMACLAFCKSYAAPEYQERLTGFGKVITGVSKEEALISFGKPEAASADVWFYSSPSQFYVYFSRDIAVNLYPENANVFIGAPIELKTMVSGADTVTRDVTAQSKLLLSEPGSFEIISPGLLIPKSAGSFQVFSIYKDIYSNPAYLVVSSPNQNKAEILLSIDVLPYKPKVFMEAKTVFFAFATFVSEQGYFVRDVTRESEWFYQQGSQAVQTKDNWINFPSPGSFKVFCKYRNKTSFPQETEVEGSLYPANHNLKHLKIIPEYLAVLPGQLGHIKVFATYYDNSVVDVTDKVRLEISDTRIVQRKGADFFALSEGVAEVSAEKENVKSLPVKMSVLKPGTPNLSVSPPYDREEKEQGMDQDSLLQDIKDNIKKLKDKAIRQERLFKSIKVVPSSLNIPLGREGQFKAVGVRPDNSEEDITIPAKWESQDLKVVTVDKGRAVTVAQGRAKVRVRYKDFLSDWAVVFVNDPELTAISIFPLEQELSMDRKGNLSAKGHFTDSSEKDISALASWEIEEPAMLKVINGQLNPLKVGKARVAASYSNIKSPAAIVNIVHEEFWLLKKILKILFFVFIAIFAVFTVLYLLTEQKRTAIISLLGKNNNSFIIALYENLTGALPLFGHLYSKSVPPLFYAASVEKLYAIEEKWFTMLTRSFEEAKYSGHVLKKEDSDFALKNYNLLLKRVFSRQKKTVLLLVVCLALIKRVPVIISKK